MAVRFLALLLLPSSSAAGTSSCATNFGPEVAGQCTNDETLAAETTAITHRAKQRWRASLLQLSSRGSLRASASSAVSSPAPALQEIQTASVVSELHSRVEAQASEHTE